MKKSWIFNRTLTGQEPSLTRMSTNTATAKMGPELNAHKA